MQYIGTDVFRNDIQRVMPGIGEDFWVRRLVEATKGCDVRRTPIVVSDMRFMNEYEILRQFWGDRLKVWRIEREEAQAVDDAYSVHVSEQEFMEIPCDTVLKNNGDVAGLIEQVNAAISSIKSDHAAARCKVD